MSQFAFGQTVDLTRLQPTGITALTATDCQQAQQAGYQLKLLAQAERHGSNLYVRVAPTAIPQTSALSQVAGVQNGVAITSDAIGDSLYTGPGAGSTATANSVLNDVLVAANHLVTATRGLAFNRNHVQLRVHALDQLPQRYLLVSSLSRLTLQTYANEVDFSIQPTAGPALITTAVTPTQLAQLQRLTTINGQAQVTAIPIAFSTQPAAAAVTAIQAVS